MASKKIIERFVSYVTIDTQSDPESTTTPSTEKQWNLAKKLVEDLKQIGMQDVSIDEYSYVMATLPSNIDKNVSTIGFIAHFDTSPDFSGKDVKPQIHENYDGNAIDLKAGNRILSPEEFEELKLYKGQTLITTDGTTLLGADDKAGVTEIVTAMEYLIEHPEIKHGKIRVCFTPDEEIGRGPHKFDVKKFAADWAYTMDGSQVGELEYESFNAASAKITIKGKSIHPGSAKGKMINSQYIAQEYIAALPKMETPEHTEKREGYYHLTNMQGNVSETVLSYIIRDHDKVNFEARKKKMQNIVETLNQQHGKNTVSIKIEDQYYNMGEKITPNMHIIDLAKAAFKELNIEPRIQAIRGGTDGSQLSFMGLPCPNIFAGGHNFHGPYEYVPVESMEKAVEVICKIAELNAL